MLRRCVWIGGLVVAAALVLAPYRCLADGDYDYQGSSYGSNDGGSYYIETQAAISTPDPGDGFAWGGNVIAECYVPHQSRHYFYVYSGSSPQHSYTWIASFQTYQRGTGGYGAIAIGYPSDSNWLPYLPSDSLSPYIPSDGPTDVTISTSAWWTSDAYSRLFDNDPSGQESGGSLQADHTHDWFCSECGQGCPPQ